MSGRGRGRAARKQPGRPAVSSVADYMTALAPTQSRALKQVLAVARKSVPRSSSVISYGIPALKLERVFMFCAAFRHHIGIYPPVRDDARLRAALKPYANAKGNLRFSLDEPMPLRLMARVAKALAKQYAAAIASRPKRTQHRGSR
jgi:uncharacterized protein YdhG (YjbR/CyaY superfamily)